MSGKGTQTLIVAAELYVSCGEYARGRWVEEPTARYDCHRCHTTEGPVTGEGPVKAFVEHVKSIHHGRCPAQSSQRPEPKETES